MHIEAVDFFYASMPNVTLDADGSQDALLVRVSAGGFEGWGECEASPLVSIAAFVTPRSHGVCQPVSASVLGERIDSPDDISRIAALVERNSMDLLQSAHTFSGIEIALWDLLGKAREQPVWQMLGYTASHPKIAYASMLFGESPQQTLELVRAATAKGHRAVKVGWGGFGSRSPEADADQLVAAREGLGAEGVLLVDAGQIWVDDVEAGALRIPALEAARATWVEEPFAPHALQAHADLGSRMKTVGVAGGEGAHNAWMAKNLIDFGRIQFVQVDTGRIGGISQAKIVADHAVARGVRYVNHTFTSDLALSASLQPFAGLADHRICEYPAAPSALAQAITRESLTPDASGQIRTPEAPGLGLSVDVDALAPYLRSVEIRIDGSAVYSDTEREGRLGRP